MRSKKKKENQFVCVCVCASVGVCVNVVDCHCVLFCLSVCMSDQWMRSSSSTSSSIPQRFTYMCAFAVHCRIAHRTCSDWRGKSSKCWSKIADVVFQKYAIRGEQTFRNYILSYRKVELLRLSPRMRTRYWHLVSIPWKRNTASPRVACFIEHSISSKKGMGGWEARWYTTE